MSKMDKVSKKNFTKTEIINQIEVKDSTIEIVGFCTEMTSNQDGTNTLFKKIIVNNADDKRVQVVAWGNQKKKLFNIDKDGIVVHITSLTASVPKDEKYNIGNVPFELIIKPNSKVNILGMFDDKDVPELKYHEIELNKVDKFVGKKIVTHAFVKTPLALLKSKDHSFNIGSVTDGNVKVEVRTNISDFQKIEKGKYVELHGKVMRFLRNPPYVMFEEKKEWEEKKAAEGLSTETIIGVFKYPEA